MIGKRLEDKLIIDLIYRRVELRQKPISASTLTNIKKYKLTREVCKNSHKNKRKSMKINSSNLRMILKLNKTCIDINVKRLKKDLIKYTCIAV